MKPSLNVMNLRLLKNLLFQTFFGLSLMAGLSACKSTPLTAIPIPEATRNPMIGPPATPTADASQSWNQLTSDNIINMELLVERLDSSIADFVWSPDSRVLGIRYADPSAGITILDRATLSETLHIDIQSAGPISFSSDNRLLAIAALENTIQIYNAIYGNQVMMLKGHSAPVVEIAFSSEGDLLVSFDQNLVINFWLPASGQLWKTINAPQGVETVQFAQDGRSAALVNINEFKVILYNLIDQQVIKELNWIDHASPVLYRAELTPNWLEAAWVTRNLVMLMNVDSGEMNTMIEHQDFVGSIALDPASKLLASASFGTLNDQTTGILKFWDIINEASAGEISHPGVPTKMSFSNDIKVLATLTSDGNLRLWGIPPR